MNAQELIARGQQWSKDQAWQLYANQISVLLRNELRRNLLTRRRVWIYFLAFIPVLFILIHTVVDRPNLATAQIEEDTKVLAGIIQL